MKATSDACFDTTGKWGFPAEDHGFSRKSASDTRSGRLQVENDGDEGGNYPIVLFIYLSSIFSLSLPLLKRS